MIPRLVEPYAPLPPVIQRAEREEEPQPAPLKGKKLLIVHSKDVSSEERKIFQFWGKVAVWDDRYINIPLERLPESDYVFMDMRLKSARVAIGSADLSKYAVVSYVPWYHKGEKFISKGGGKGKSFLYVKYRHCGSVWGTLAACERLGVTGVVRKYAEIGKSHNAHVMCAIDKIIKDRNKGTLNEESKLRKVIREMIDAELEEAYQLVNINLKAPKKDREERELARISWNTCTQCFNKLIVQTS